MDKLLMAVRKSEKFIGKRCEKRNNFYEVNKKVVNSKIVIALTKIQTYDLKKISEGIIKRKISTLTLAIIQDNFHHFAFLIF
jgi:hypothetical protein